MYVEREQDVLRAASMYYLQDLKMEVIARHLGTSRSTVSRLIKRARQAGLDRRQRSRELVVFGDDARAPRLVVGAAEDLFPRVGQGTVTDVVEERGDLDVARDLAREAER